MPVNVDWNNIRPLNGSRSEGFEEFCAQLANVERPPGSTFVRKGTPDAGVECYAILSDGAEWGWQAKYFPAGLGDPQWSQLDRSIKTALEKHPRLVRYFVCIPYNFPDARVEGRTSAKERWDEHAAKWSRWATEKGMSVEFVYWGSYELLERLSRSEHAGRVRFWFNVRRFDPAWFSARLDEAIRTARPRYTHDLHVDLPIAQEFEAFGRTHKFFDSMRALARPIRQKLKEFQYSTRDLAQSIGEATAALFKSVETVLEELGGIQTQSTENIPFGQIIDHICEAIEKAEKVSDLLDKCREENAARVEGTARKETDTRSYSSDPLRDCQIQLFDLISELQDVAKALGHADSIANSALMIVRGDAGTGKTHLLCDVAKRRIDAGKPTVLLMGQRFVSNEEPWRQALQQMDAADLSTEEFVGSLEAAAEASGSRALLMIDAINEGNGRTIWPSHLPAFLAHIERSPWIGVVLAIRSSYEEIIVPEEVRNRAAVVTHDGFGERAYDAMKSFFVHYGLELPSTPLLAPEFHNPFFLKTLCQALKAEGKRRLPRGFRGITAVFNMYLDAVNRRLAETLDFNPNQQLVRQALEAVVEAFVESGDRWLTVAEAEEIVNAFLPSRVYRRSLYCGLLTEDVLVEDVAYHGSGQEVVVFLAYDRFADHLMAKVLLDRHLDKRSPFAAFAPDGPLSFVCDESEFIFPGLLEALCIQVPERIGQELVTIAPECAKRWGLGDAFRQSLIWRDYSAFSDGTRKALNELCQTKHDIDNTLDTLLTVATLPGHPLNAIFLDRWLRKDSMPDRDAWWSVYLHRAWGTHGAVDRLVDWAASVTPGLQIDDETVDLCAISLAWMFTTSNRFLRDRATKALVSLLTGRLAAVVRLVRRFADVDDPYVVERMYAVAYGVAMRCHDPGAVGELARCVYERVFAAGNPPPHILLRDYARGVVERAVYLGSETEVDVELISPPYGSQWPKIPTEDEIKPFLPEQCQGSGTNSDRQRARNDIAYSVMHGDFARYVIETHLRNWLSLTMDEPNWTPPPRPEDQLQSLLSEFSDDEREAWERYEASDKAYRAAIRSFMENWFAQSESGGESGRHDLSDMDTLVQELAATLPDEVALLEKERTDALAALRAVLTDEHWDRVEQILDAMQDSGEQRRPPRLDPCQIQRYILRRVFDLGWTVERFGNLDQSSVRYYGREARKPERIGKKYQWIAYHEIMALVSDHFQYYVRYWEEEADEVYEGPWQVGLRDIDPSCTIRAVGGGTSPDGDAMAWWGPARYESWQEHRSPEDWVSSCDDLPGIEELLVVRNPDDGLQWLNGQGFFEWKQQLAADIEPTEVERRELWYLFTGYLIRADEAASFLQWAEGVDFWGRWMPEPATGYREFLGEYGWAPAARCFHDAYYGDSAWTRPEHGCPAKIRTVAFEYAFEGAGFDCSGDESYTLQLPVTELVTGLGIRWNGKGADFIDSEGRIAVQDPTVHADGPSALLLRQDLLQRFLAREKITICWAVLGEKYVRSPLFGTGPYHPSLRMSGACVLSEGTPTGFVKYMLFDPNSQDPSSEGKVIQTVRHGPER